MAITLGKDATISVGGAIVGVRNVTLSTSARTIDIEEYGIRFASVYSTGREATLSMEVNDDTSLSALVTAHNNGDELAVSSSPGGWSFPVVITGISQTASIDGVVTFQIEARMTRSGLRA